MQTRLLINGQLVAGAGTEAEVVNPATGAGIVKIREASPDQVDQAVEAARLAYRSWGATTPQERSLLLLKLADRIEQDAAAFAELESLNCGKPKARALADEMPAIVDCFRYFAGAARCLHGSAADEYLPNHTSMIRRDPVGVVAQITPWNYPLMMAAWKLAPALAAGNAVVIKPSEMTPLTTLKLGELLAEIFPKGVVNIVHGRGDYTKPGVIEKVTSPEDVEHEFINLIKPYLVQADIYPLLKSTWKTYAKEHDIDKDNLDSIIAFSYYYSRYVSFGGLYSYTNVETDFEHFYDCSMSQSKIRQLETVLRVMKTLNAVFEVDAELVLTSSTNEVNYKDIFSIGDFSYMLRIPRAGSKYTFYNFGSNLYNVGEIPASIESETYKYIQQNTIFKSGRDMSQEKADQLNGKAVAFKTTATDNFQTDEVYVEMDSANIQLLNMKRKSTAGGHLRRDLQNATLILEDYLKAERRLLDKDTDLEEEWNKDKYFRKYWDDASQSMRKAKKEQKEKLLKELTSEYDEKPKELKTFTILQKGFSGTGSSAAIEEEFSMDGWVKKAGNNYIVEAGKFVGGQLEIKADQRERKLDIYMPFARSFNYNVTFKIPEGYTAEGIEKLNKSIKNECGGFESTAKIEGNKLVITYNKYYSNTIEPAANWAKILAFVDAGFAFTKEKVLLKKK